MYITKIFDERFKDTKLPVIFDHQESENKIYCLFSIEETKDKLGDIFDFIRERCNLVNNQKDRIYEEVSVEHNMDISIRKPKFIPLMLRPLIPGMLIKILRKIFFIKEFKFTIVPIDIDNQKISNEDFKLSKLNISPEYIICHLVPFEYIKNEYYIKISDGKIIYISQNDLFEAEFKEISKTRYVVNLCVKIFFGLYIGWFVIGSIISIISLALFGKIPFI